ncbi:hypothetical protein GCM10008918_12840 [Lactobacillus kefiranofaciens subsp. kefiranofaciens]|nr:Hypothetical protein WANG_1184 [Lactobacillus kefiranofaciens subsp. kefiranofaciens]
MSKSPFDQRIEEFFRNYQDRGMKKWVGFFLSDHTAKINQSTMQRKMVYAKNRKCRKLTLVRLCSQLFVNIN